MKQWVIVYFVCDYKKNTTIGRIGDNLANNLNLNHNESVWIPPGMLNDD